MKEKFNFDGTLKAVQYRGVYQNTILDWQPDETHGYPEGTNIYVKEKEQWVPYTGIFFKEEHLKALPEVVTSRVSVLTSQSTQFIH